MRFSTSRTVLALLGAALLIFFLVRRPPSAPSLHQTAETKPFAAPALNERLPMPSMPLKDARVHQENNDLFRSVRISPSELYRAEWKREYVTKRLSYDGAAFRQSVAPILWLDEQGDVRWNAAAEHGMLNYLAKKQFPPVEPPSNGSLTSADVSKICGARSLFLLQQNMSGFFSRVLCLIAQFGQTLYTPRVGVLFGSSFGASRGELDDFLNEGIKRYFLPFSICAAHEQDPAVKQLTNPMNRRDDALHVMDTNGLLEHRTDRSDYVLWSDEYWKIDYHHVPIRKWLFDREHSLVAYDSPVHVLTDHTDEHIYAPRNQLNVTIGEWITRNTPDAFPSDLVVKQRTNRLTWRDYVFGSFLRYMFVLFLCSRNAPRIELGARLLAQYWRSYLSDKYAVTPGTNVFDSLAGIYIRRGDKRSEDTFWAKHQYWRNISLYVKAIVDEEQRQKTKFDYIFVMTAETSVMESIQDYARKDSSGTDEPYARKHLRGRDILYNIMAPHACSNAFSRIDLEHFQISIRFLVEHAVLTVGHTNSNVFRFFREVVYAQRQLRPEVQTYTYVRNAPDSFHVNTTVHPPLQ